MTTVMLKEAKERLEDLLKEKDFAVRLDDGTTVLLEVKRVDKGKKRRGAYGSAKGWFTMREDFDEPLELEGAEKPRPVFGSGKGWFTDMADDFDEPLEDFKDYME